LLRTNESVYTYTNQVDYRFGRLLCSERNIMPTYAPNIELLYTQYSDYSDRIRAAAADGFTSVELWMTSPLDLQSLAAAATESGVRISSVLAEPRFNFTLPGADFSVFFDGLHESIARAKVLGAPRVVLGSGVGFPGKKRQPQLDQLVEVFKEAAQIAESEGIELVLEPVNTRVDHPGALLDGTEEAIYIAENVASPNFKILYDIYHSSVESEDVIALLKKHSGLIGYIQLADAPGRGEPGSGGIDWKPILQTVDAIGYDEVVGLEYYPTKDTTESLSYLRSL
jgi:hydroxypyruvate isomerase